MKAEIVAKDLSKYAKGTLQQMLYEETPAGLLLVWSEWTSFRKSASFHDLSSGTNRPLLDGFERLVAVRGGNALFVTKGGDLENENCVVVSLQHCQVLDRFSVQGKVVGLAQDGFGVFSVSPDGGQWRIFRRAISGRREEWGCILGVQDWHLHSSFADLDKVVLHAVNRKVLDRNVGMLGFISLAKKGTTLELKDLPHVQGQAYNPLGGLGDAAFGSVFCPTGPRALIVRNDDYVQVLSVPHPAALSVIAMYPGGVFPCLVVINESNRDQLYWHHGMGRLFSVRSTISDWPPELEAGNTIFAGPAVIGFEQIFLMAASGGKYHIVKLTC